MRVELTVERMHHCAWRWTPEHQHRLSTKILNRSTWTAMKHPPLQPSETAVSTLTQENGFRCREGYAIKVCYKQQTRYVSLLVVPMDGPVIVWLETGFNAIILDWTQLNRIYKVHRTESCKTCWTSLLTCSRKEWAHYEALTLKIHIQPRGPTKIFFCARRLPYALRDKITHRA